MAVEPREKEQSVDNPPDWKPSDTLDDKLWIPPVLQFPDGWRNSTSWQRAQQEPDAGGPVNDAERMVFLDESDRPHRVVFVVRERTLRAECSCTGWKFRGFCAHVASLWWQWTRAEITVRHLRTGRSYQEPPSWLRVDCTPDTDLQSLTPAELDAYLHCELGTSGPTAWAEHTGRAKGTIGNLLRSAREKLPDRHVHRDPHPHAGGGSA